MIDYDTLTIKLLHQECKQLNITGYSKKNKPELIQLLKDKTNKNVEVKAEKETVDTNIITNNNKNKKEGFKLKLNNKLQKLKQKIEENKQYINQEKQNKEYIKTEELKFIDLFCGIGGFHQALHKLGHKCVLACDIDKDCREVYKNNYGIEPLSNVKNIDEQNMVDFDILCAGFPCQAFSNGGHKKCFDDARGLLFDEIIRIAKVKQPKFMFLENVKHILKVSDGKVMKHIETQIDNNNYKLQIFKMSPHNYGIPQQRERIYFVCIRKDIYNNTDIMLPNYLGPKSINFDEFLDKKETINEKYFIKDDILNILETWDEIIKVFETDEKLSPTIMAKYILYKPSDIEMSLFPDWKQQYISKNKPLIEKYKTELENWYNKNKDILTKKEIYSQLDWQCGLKQENDSIFNHFIQIRQSGIRVKKGNNFPTLVAISQIPIYGKEKRYITPRECARLQSFPDSFKLPNEDRKSYKQLGNSVNVNNVLTVIQTTLEHYTL
jgi:DNA (cytosine-5)-methyltransferase 1